MVSNTISTMHSARYTKVAVLLHWLIAIGIISQFLFGWFMEGLPKEAPKQLSFDLFDWGIYTWQVSINEHAYNVTKK